MCDLLECHGSGLRITRVHVIHTLPDDTLDDQGNYWVVEFRTGGFLASYHREWKDALSWAQHFLALESGHGS